MTSPWSAVTRSLPSMRSYLMVRIYPTGGMPPLAAPAWSSKALLQDAQPCKAFWSLYCWMRRGRARWAYAWAYAHTGQVAIHNKAATSAVMCTNRGTEGARPVTVCTTRGMDCVASWKYQCTVPALVSLRRL